LKVPVLHRISIMSSSSTSTSLTLRALLKTASGRLGLGVPGRSVSGL